MLGIFAALSVVGFIGAYVGPTGAALAEAAPAVEPMSLYSTAVLGAQSYEVETLPRRSRRHSTAATTPCT